MSIIADVEEKLARVQEELGQTRTNLEEERQRAQDANDLTQRRQEEVDTVAHDAITQLELELGDAITKDSDNEKISLSHISTGEGNRKVAE